MIRKPEYLSFVLAAAIFVCAFYAAPAFAQDQSSQTATAAQEDKLKKLAVQVQSIDAKLDASAEREKQILANQDKILEEVHKTITWRRPR